MDMCHSPSPADMQRGAYLLLEPHRGLADCAVIFSEEDSELMKKAALILSVQGIAARLIAVRDFSLLEKQNADYQHMLFRTDLPLFAAVPEGCSWAEKLSAPIIPPTDANHVASCVKSALFAE